MGRAATGVRGMLLEKDDEVMTMEVVEPDKTLLSVTDRGIGKRTPVDDYRVQTRGGKGIITIKTSDENGFVVGVLKVNDTDEAMLITTNGQAIRIPVSGISVIGRNTKGVRLFRVAEGEKVVSVTKIVEPADGRPGEEVDDDGGEENGDAAAES
jgi:DNA gyrase subunit A